MFNPPCRGHLSARTCFGWGSQAATAQARTGWGRTGRGRTRRPLPPLRWTRVRRVAWQGQETVLTRVVRREGVYGLLGRPLVVLPEGVVLDAQAVEDVDGGGDAAGGPAADVHELDVRELR